ncbi:MAG: glycosyltransferase [Pseudomonadales bacterium]|nr:glycosyltransferase [Pseudomonadales bacterium]
MPKKKITKLQKYKNSFDKMKTQVDGLVRDFVSRSLFGTPIRVARIGNMHQPYPPALYGGTQRSMSQMTVYQTAIFGHHIYLYGPADSAIIDYASEIFRSMGLRYIKFGSTVWVRTDTKKWGMIKLRTTGSNAVDYSDPDEESLQTSQLVELLKSDDDRITFDIIHNHHRILAVTKFKRDTYCHRTITHCHNELLPMKFVDLRPPIICISESQAKNLKEKYQANVCEVIYHGLDPYTFKLGENTAGYLAWLGHISPKKGVDAAIKIAQKAEMPLLIAGAIRSLNEVNSQYYQSEVEPYIDCFDESFLDSSRVHTAEELQIKLAEVIARLGKKNPIVYVGAVNDIQKQSLFGAAIATLFPIKWSEPFGRVIIESMACGAPVVGFAQIGDIHCGSVEEVIDNGKTGFHIRAANEDEAIVIAAEYVGKAASLDRKKVRDIFEEQWSSQRVAAQIDGVYREMLKTAHT